MSTYKNDFNKWNKNQSGMDYGSLIFLGVVIAVIAIIAWFVVRGINSSPGASTVDKPSITLTSGFIVLKPDSSGTTSEYRMEYADPSIETYFTSEVNPANINLEVSWKNGNGFKSNKVEALVFMRYVSSADSAPPEPPGSITDDNITSSGVSSPEERTEEDQIKDFGGGTVTFLGSDLKDGETGVGNNVVAVYYRMNGSSILNLLKTSNVITITQAQLDSTLNIDTIQRLKFSVTPDSLEVAIKDDPEYTWYVITSKSGTWTTDYTRMRVDDDENLIFLDKYGTKQSIWPGGPTSVKISSHIQNYILIHADSDDTNVKKFWAYDSVTDNLIEKDDSVMMNDESEFQTALFTLTSVSVGSEAPVKVDNYTTIYPLPFAGFALAGGPWSDGLTYSSPDGTVTLKVEGQPGRLVLRKNNIIRWTTGSTHKFRFKDGELEEINMSGGTSGFHWVSLGASGWGDNTKILALYNSGRMAVLNSDGTVHAVIVN